MMWFRPVNRPWLVVLAAALLVVGLQAHPGSHASVHDTVAAVALRLRDQLPASGREQFSLAAVEAALTPGEREVLGGHHLTFQVDRPAVVTVLRDPAFGADPFWLVDRGFRDTGVTVGTGAGSFTAWERSFPAGEVGLGINSLRGGGNHYFVAVRPETPGDVLTLDGLFPGQLRLGELRAGARPYVDRSEVITNLPPALDGQILIQTDSTWRDAGRLLNLFRWTDHPATSRPDQVVLTWSGDPQTTQAIQWRTSTRVRQGRVAWVKRSDHFRPRPVAPREMRASKPVRLTDPYLVNQLEVHRFSAVLTGLEAGTTYLYAVGDGSRAGWTEFAEFTTAPATVVPFAFVYMGDAQNGLDRWGTLLQQAYRTRPDAAFYLMAGDLVNRGSQRDDWDSFFHNSRGVFDRRPLVPVIGNHENQGGHPTLYLRQFTLPGNGPAGVEPGRSYAFEYSNALFVILDSNLDPATQTEWLETQLERSRATWKFVSYHHPAYSSVPRRDNAAIRDAWTPVFDRHHVDLALQGHDHAYLRTYPLKASQRVATPRDGTVYIVSVSGTKMYPQDPRDYTEVGLTNVPLYQVLDLQISGNRLVYRAYDIDGTLRDRLVIEK